MTAQDIFSVAETLKKISDWQYVVTKERFSRVAMTKFGISDDSKTDYLFGLFGSARGNFVYINSAYDRYHITENMPLALQIAEETYNIYSHNHSVPGIPSDGYYNKDIRRYFVREQSKRYSVDVNLKEKSSIVTFANLLQREGIEIDGVTHVLGKLERRKDGKTEETNYFEGDIVFVCGNPTDSMWRSWYRHRESGVFLATDKGWGKLLYTPGRGYVNGKREVEFESDDRWNEHMIQGLSDGKEWRYVGNIHDDIAVLLDKEAVENEDDQDCNE